VQLQAAVGTQAAVQLHRLLVQEGVVAAAVDGGVEAVVAVEVAVRVARIARRPAGLVCGHQLGALALRHAARGESSAHRLELAHDLEHLEQPARADAGTTAPRRGRISIRPSVASWISASRTGVRETP
jgi:hypothetical protein